MDKINYLEAVERVHHEERKQVNEKVNEREQKLLRLAALEENLIKNL